MGVHVDVLGSRQHIFYYGMNLIVRERLRSIARASGACLLQGLSFHVRLCQLRQICAAFSANKSKSSPWWGGALLSAAVEVEVEVEFKIFLKRT